MTCETVFATAATADRTHAELGVIWWLTDVDGFALGVADYDLFDMTEVNSAWIGEFFERSAEIVEEHAPKNSGCLLRLDHPGLTNVMRRAEEAFSETEAADHIDRAAYRVKPVSAFETAKWPATFDERAYSIRPLIDSKKVIRPATGLRRFTWKSVCRNHLAAQLRAHRPGEPAGELAAAFVLGAMLGATAKPMTFFKAMDRMRAADKRESPSPFAAGYIPGRRPR